MRWDSYGYKMVMPGTLVNINILNMFKKSRDSKATLDVMVRNKHAAWVCAHYADCPTNSFALFRCGPVALQTCSDARLIRADKTILAELTIMVSAE